MLEKLPVEDRKIFREMLDDELFYINTEFAHSSDAAVKAAINESCKELSRGFPQLTEGEIKEFMLQKIEAA